MATKSEDPHQMQRFSGVGFRPVAVILYSLLFLGITWIMAHSISPIRDVVTDWEQAFCPRGTIVSYRGRRLAKEFYNLRNWARSAMEVSTGRPPVDVTTLIQTLDRISPHPKHYSPEIQIIRSGKDPWGEKLQYRVESIDRWTFEISIWSTGINRRDEAGGGDDIDMKLLWIAN